MFGWGDVMDRGSRIVLGGLALVIALAFVTLGPGRTLYEPAAAQDMSAGPDEDAHSDPGFESDPVVTTIELEGNRTGYSLPDPLEDDGTGVVSAPRTGPVVTPASRAAASAARTESAARSRDTERRGQRAAEDASGLNDGDLSTTGDLAF